MSNAYQLAPDEIRAIADIWQANPGASACEVARIASGRLRRSLSHSSVLRHRPASVPARDRPAILTPEQQRAVADIWRECPGATVDGVAAVATRRLGRTVGHTTANRLRPGPSARPRLTPEGRETLARLWAEDPEATGLVIARRASTALGRPVGERTAVKHRPDGTRRSPGPRPAAKDEAAPPPAPTKRQHSGGRPAAAAAKGKGKVDPLPYESPLEGVILHARLVWQRIRRGVAS